MKIKIICFLELLAIIMYNKTDALIVGWLEAGMSLRDYKIKMKTIKISGILHTDSVVSHFS